MKIDRADKLFSIYIRTRDGWRCQRCGGQYQQGDSGLHCSHFFGRVNECTRFDPLNCVSLCFGCHKYFDETNREAYREFKIKQIGEEEFKKLRLRADSYCRKDRKLAYLTIKQLLKEYRE